MTKFRIEYKSDQHVTALFGNEKYDSESSDECWSREDTMVVENAESDLQPDEHGEINVYFDPTSDGIVEVCIPVRHIELINDEPVVTDDVIGRVTLTEIS